MNSYAPPNVLLPQPSPSVNGSSTFPDAQAKKLSSLAVLFHSHPQIDLLGHSTTDILSLKYGVAKIQPLPTTSALTPAPSPATWTVGSYFRTELSSSALPWALP